MQITDYFAPENNANEWDGRIIVGRVHGTQTEDKYGCDLDAQINYDKLFRKDSDKTRKVWNWLTFNQETGTQYDD